jgi:hypothetical protein
MKFTGFNSARSALWSLSAILLCGAAHRAEGEGIIYGQFPTFSPAYFSYDFEGTRLDAAPGSPAQIYALQINGQTAYIFYSQSEFGIIPSSSNAVLAIQPGLPNSEKPFAIPLVAGQSIGPEAGAYGWVSNLGYANSPLYNGSLLTSSRDGHTVGEPPLTSGYFTGLESAYIGIRFQQNGQSYYGWIRVGAPFVELNGGWIFDYAYETTAEKPIIAGAGLPSTNRFLATFNGTNQVRRNTSAHTGSGTFTLRGRTLSYFLKFDPGFRPIAAKIQGPANPKSNSHRVVADLGEFVLVDFPQRSVYHGEVVLTQKELKQLFEGRLYLNFPSVSFPRGELRGHIVPATRH